jgi:hypothetical protein
METSIDNKLRKAMLYVKVQWRVGHPVIVG